MIQWDLLRVNRTMRRVSRYIVLAIYIIETKNSNSYTRRNKYTVNIYIEPT